MTELSPYVFLDADLLADAGREVRRAERRACESGIVTLLPASALVIGDITTVALVAWLATMVVFLFFCGSLQRAVARYHRAREWVASMERLYDSGQER